MGVTRTGETTATSTGVKKPAIAARSACTVTVGTTMLNGVASAAAGQPGQCFPGSGRDGPSSAGLGWLSLPAGRAATARERHEAHVQSARGFASCDAESSRTGDADGGADAVPAGTNWQMHMPGGMSIGGSIRSSTNALSIASPPGPDLHGPVNHIDRSTGPSIATPGRVEPSGWYEHDSTTRGAGE
jgi:hypothetical protein